jgi:hypothetical protein
VLSYWDVLVVALLGGIILVPRPDRYRNAYRALTAYVLACALTAAVYLLVSRPPLWPVLADLGGWVL